MDKKLGIIISGSWNSLRNKRMNGDYIDVWRSWGFLDGKITSGYGLKTEVVYWLSPKISIGGGLSYISGSTDVDRPVVDYSIDDTITVHDYVNTSLYAPSFSLRYHVRKDEFDFSLGISESFLFGKASRQHTSSSYWGGFDTLKNDFHASGLGFQLFGGIHYRFSNFLSYTVEIGYRKFETGDLVEEDSNMAMRANYGYIDNPVNLDYSGPYISAGLMFRLF